jgi:signal transduction histidine kinase
LQRDSPHRRWRHDRSLDAGKYRALKTGRALVEVTDTGCGIPDIIDANLRSGIQRNGDTPGLGLAVCKRLMTSHGGEIRVSSRVNCGTTFQLEFPTL